MKKDKEPDEPISNGGKRYNDPVTGKFTEGNPGGGRPKGSVSIVELIKKKLEEVAELKNDPKNKKTYAELLVTKMFSKALIDGDTTMLKDITDRIDGKPNQTIRHETPVPTKPLSEEAQDRLKQCTDDNV